MEKTDTTPQDKKRFGLPAVLISGLLIGLLGFSLGTNFDGLPLARHETVNDELPEDLDYDSVEDVYDQLRQNYAGELSEEELLDGLKRGLANATGDPFTEYLDGEEARELNQSLDGEFGGIGAEIGVRDDQLVIIAPLDGTPADEAGLRPQDAIIEIDGESTADLSVQQAVNQIRGEEGTEVTLSIVRGNGAPEDIAITRGHIEVPSVEYELRKDGIGYIELIRFGSDSATDFRQAAQELRDQGADSIILDVRGNPGGLLGVAVDITSEFLESGKTIVEERRQDEVVSTEQARGNGVLEGLPTVVLINEGSASASEIIAGALRDHGAAQLVGKQTFGKGSVQELVDLRGDSILRVTIAQWHTPEGHNINEEGIEPDVEVELSEEDFQADRDPQLQKAIELLSEG